MFSNNGSDFDPRYEVLVVGPGFGGVAAGVALRTIAVKTISKGCDVGDGFTKR